MLSFTSCALWIMCALVLALPWIRFLPPGPGSAGASSAAYVAPLVVCAVAHEACRRALWLLQTRWTTDALEKIARHFGYRRVSSCDRMSMSLAWGFGQGVAHCIFFFASNAFLSQGPGTYYIDSCPHVPFFLATALTSLAFVAIHTAIMLLVSYDHGPMGTSQYVFVHGAQVFSCLLTLGNLYPGGCVIVLPTLLAIAMALMSCAATLFLSTATITTR